MKSASAIRLTITPDVARALRIAKRRYPALSEPEILKVGLSHLAAGRIEAGDDRAELEALAAQAVGEDYLSDSAEDIYHLGMGKKVHSGHGG